MKPGMFHEPVTVLVGLGFPVEIRGVTEAYRHLCEWPQALRDRAHAVAVNACRAALSDEIEAETARSLFVAFAEKHDLLAPDCNSLVAFRRPRDKNPNVR